MKTKETETPVVVIRRLGRNKILKFWRQLWDAPPYSLRVCLRNVTVDCLDFTVWGSINFVSIYPYSSMMSVMEMEAAKI